MSLRLRASIAAASVAAALLFASSNVLACSCTNEKTLLEEFNAAAVVFGGTVTDIQPAGDGVNEIVTFTPTVRWKGGLDAAQNVLDALNEGICGFPFQLGQSYLVFAFNTTFNGHPAIFTHLCSRDSFLDGNADVGNLPPPELPVPARAHTWGALKAIYR